MPPTSRSRLWLFLALPFALYVLFNVVGGGIYAIAVMSAHHLSDQTLYCESPDEARAARVFIDTVLVEPRVVRYGPYTVTFENCWVGQLRNSHRENWYSRRVVTKQPRATVNLTLWATHNNQPIKDTNDSPILSCEQSNGGIYLGQQPRQQLTAYADLLPDGSLNVELPLALALDYGLKKAPQVRFIAYPASFKKRPTDQSK